VPPWEISVDTGGTFTDCLARDPEGAFTRVKILSSGCLRARVVACPAPGALRLSEDWHTPPGFFRGFRTGRGANVTGWNPESRVLETDGDSAAAGDLIELSSGEEAPVLGARLLTGTCPGAEFPPLVFRLATTRATNTLLEGKAAPTALFITAGFGDLLHIGDQRRPDLFALRHAKPAPLFQKTVEVAERLDADGNVLVPLDLASVAVQARALVASGITCAAVALAHSYRNPAHEIALAAALVEAGFEHVSGSAALAPVIRLLPRAQTAVIDACLSPVLGRFVKAVAQPLGNRPLLLMNSAGGLESAGDFRPKDSLLSGPAGGATGAAAIAHAAGLSRVIAFDMGGTSTDVCRIDGALPFQFEHRVGAAVLLAPSVQIETVAAGGGSICALKPGGLAVGPESAGADPGPACYGRGGPLTLTDVNLLLGRLDPEKTGIPLDTEASRARLAELRRAMADQGLDPPPERALLEGLLEIGIERMADAIRRISLREGFEPGVFTLVAFGGAGPQHACAVAEKLGIGRILVPRDAGLLSAFGLQCARIEKIAERQILAPLDPDCHRQTLADLESTHPQPVVRRIAEIRLTGQDSPLAFDFVDPAELPGMFRDRHSLLFGYAPPSGRALELVSLRVVSAEPGEAPPAECFADIPALTGPHLLQDAFCTLVLAAGWQARAGDRGSHLLERVTAAAPPLAPPREAVEMELYHGRFASLVEDMGVLLRRTAISTNVKERADFSCALLDANGELVLNAPHIPVHLGALGLCVREVARRLPLGPGDMAVTNHPAFGGSHLPDVTVISAAFDGNGERIAYVANRAHHAEIGGISPGSMPPGARTLAKEGVVISPRYLFREGVARFDAVADLLAGARFPTRRLDDNFLFGNACFGYYETIGGGAGAGPGYSGADALHTHLTNTALTDVEILESRYPVRVRAFGIRKDSGGKGKWHGGNGIVREIEFLAPLTVSLLTQHRNAGPYGMDGGENGAPGRQSLTRPDGATETLPAIASRDVLPGTLLHLETPGGGGFGPENPMRQRET